MPTFVKKPIHVEAVLFTGANLEEIQEFVGFREISGVRNRDGSIYKINNFQDAGTFAFWDDPDIRGEVFDKLHSTWVGVKVGQWIMKGTEGEFYPCADDGTGKAPLNYQLV